MKIIQFPLAKFILFFIFGIAVSSQFEYRLSVALGFNLVILSILVVTHFYTLKNKNHKITFDIVLCLCAVFAGLTFQKTHDQRNKQTHYTHIAFQTPKKLKLIIREKLKPNEFSDRYSAILVSIDTMQTTGKIILKIKKGASPVGLTTGNIVLAHDILQLIPTPKNPNQFNYSLYLENKNIFAQLSVKSDELLITNYFLKDIWYYSAQIRSKIISQFQKKGLKNQELNVAIALLLGQRQDLDPELVKEYQYAGATHLLAVSGLHVGFVLLFLNFILKRLPHTKRGRLIKLVITVGVLSFYALLTGLSPSILRATIMFSFIAIGNYLGRVTSMTYTLLVSAFFILLFDPNSLFDVGFQLSYTAVYFIVWMQPLFKQVGRPKTILTTKIWDITTVSIAAQIGTLPLTLYYFHQFPSLFFVTNLVVIPLVTIIMFFGIIAILLGAFGILPTLLITILNKLIEILNEFIRWIASFEQFAIQDISFSLVLATTLFILIISGIRLINRFRFVNLAVFLCTIILVQSLSLYQTIQEKSSSELIILNNPLQSIISVKKQNTLVFYSNEENNTNNWNVNNYIVTKKCRVQSEQIPNFLFFENKKIMIIDSTSTYLKGFTPNILVLRQSPKINIERALQELKPQIIVADASNYKTFLSDWKKTCEAKKIPFHTTYEMGYYRTY